MFKKLSGFGEDQYYLLTPRNAQSLRQLRIALWLLFFGSAVFMIFLRIAVNTSTYVYLEIISNVMFAILIIYGLLLIVSTVRKGKILKRFYVFRTLMQVVVLSYVQIILWLLAVTIIVLANKDSHIIDIGALMISLVGGVLFNIWVLRRTIKLIAEGHYREGGSGFFKEETTPIMKFLIIVGPAISGWSFAVAMWILAAKKILPDDTLVSSVLASPIFLSLVFLALFFVFSIMNSRYLVFIHLYRKFKIEWPLDDFPGEKKKRKREIR